MMTTNRVFLAISILWVFSFVGIYAQQTTGTISGTVADETGGVLPGVSLTARNTETEAMRTVISDDEGRFRLPQLSPGTYELRAELAGFQTALLQGINLSMAQEAVVSVTLTGSLYDPPREIRPAAKGAIDRTHISGALASDFGANLAADLDWMAAGFMPKERDELKTYFTSDPRLLERNQAATQRIEQFFLKGSVRHRGHRLALVVRDHGGRTCRRVYAFSPGAKGWLRTNALSADPVFDVVFSAYLWGKITAAGKSQP